jgi:hypothetical protein
MIDFGLVRARVPLASYLESTGVKLRRVGQRYVGKCPLHGERKGESFTVQGEKWKCWGACGAQGDVLDFHMRRLGLPDLREAAKSLLGEEISFSTDSKVKTSPRPEEKPERPYQLTMDDCRRMRAACETLYRHPEHIFEVLGQRPEWDLDVIAGVALYGDLGFERDCVTSTLSGPAVLFGYSHGIKARWLIEGERQVRWLCGAPARQCWRQSLLREDHRRIYITEGEPDTLTGISLGLENDSVGGRTSGRATHSRSRTVRGQGNHHRR